MSSLHSQPVIILGLLKEQLDIKVSQVIEDASDASRMLRRVFVKPRE